MIKTTKSATGDKVLGNIDGMLEDFKQKKQPRGEKLKFEGMGSKDVYNSTAPFEYKGKRYLIGRVESPDRETDSQSVFFTGKEGVWHPNRDIPVLDLQDPFFSQIDGELIVGGVEVFPKEPILENQERLDWRTVYYRGTNPVRLKEFARGPDHMKGLRIIKLINGKIAVFTRNRPGYVQDHLGDELGATVGYIEINSLNDLTIENVNKAEVINGLFVGKEWGGVNELFLLESGCIGVLGHIARENEKDEKEYYAMTFEFDPRTKKVSNKKIVVIRDNFPDGKKKLKKGKNDNHLKNIFYPGGLLVKLDGTTELYGGLSDSEVGRITIEHPFESMIK